MLAILENPTTSQAGALVLPKDKAVHSLVHLTSTHGVFALQAIQQWLVADALRQERGVADSLDYLTACMQFLMTIAQQNQGFANVCRQEKNDQETLRKGLEATFAILQSIGMKIETLEAQCQALLSQANLLDSLAGDLDENVKMVAAVIDRLQVRLATVLTGITQTTATARAH